MKHVACNFCGRDDPELVTQGPDLLLDKPGRFRLVRCRHCGLIYQDPRLSPGELDAHYPESYLPYQHDAAGRSWLARLSRTHALSRFCRRVMRHQAPPGRLLDVGCATGAFLDAMRPRGWQVAGVEPVAHAAAAARERYGLDVFTGTLHEAAYPDAAFDVVTLWDVLEHVADPRATLVEIRRILRPGGLLAFSVPNPDSVEARLFGDAWLGWERPRHLHLIPPGLVPAYLQATGLALVRIESFTGRLGLTLLSVEFALKARGVPAARYRPWLRLAYSLPLRVLTWPLYRLAEWRNRSAMMTVFARRPAEP